MLAGWLGTKADSDGALRDDEGMLGQGWQSRGRARRRLDGVRAVYAGVPNGTEAAIDRVLSFFEGVHHLRHWLLNDPTSGVTKAEMDSLVDRDGRGQ